MTATEIDRLRGQHDMDARAEAQHARDDAATMAARCSAVTAPRNVMRAAPTSTKTSKADLGVARTTCAGGRTTTGSRRGFLAGFAGDFLRSCDRYQISVRTFTPWRRAISSASPPRASSSSRSAYQPA